MNDLNRTLPELSTADVVVVGSGSAGAVAAIAAARTGARTLLLERYGFLGGISTAVLDTFYGFYTPGANPRKVVAGLADEVVRRLRDYGQCLERPNTYGAGTGVTYHPEYLKVVWDELASEAGVKVLLHCWVQEASVSSDRICTLTVATKAGLRRVEGKVFVDASGDGDLCFFAGAPVEMAGEFEPAQSLSTTFRMANVDLSERQAISKTKVHEIMAAAAEAYNLPRKEGSDHRTPVPNMTAVNMTRVRSFEQRNGQLVNATDPEFLSACEIEGRAQAIRYIRFLKDRIPGYQSSELAALATQIGIRETRRILGQYRLTKDDVLQARQFDDQIGLCGAPIEDHGTGDSTRWIYLPEGQCVGIPYRTLLPKGVTNLLVCGRCFSATHDAHASVRSMAQCMAMGQAAGTAAAMSVQLSCDPADLTAGELCQQLRKAGAILEVPDA
jgi:FAD dependent oxidoreductase